VEDVVFTANLLRKHFLKKRYKKESLVENGILSDAKIILFRGSDQKNRMVTLLSTTPGTLEGTESTKESSYEISLKLYYVDDTNNIW